MLKTKGGIYYPYNTKKYKGEIGGSGTYIFNGYIDEEYQRNLLSFTRRMEIYDSMRKSNGTCKGILRAIKLPVESVDYNIVPASNEAIDIEIADFIKYVLFECWNWTEKLEEINTRYDFGFYVAEKYIQKKETPKQFYHLSKRNKNIWMIELKQRLAKSIESWELSNGEKGIRQYAVKNKQGLQLYEIPWQNIFHFANEQEGDNYEGISILRTAYMYWFYLDKIYKIQMIAMERGAGVPTIHRDKEIQIDKKEESKINDLLQNMRSNSLQYLQIPGGMTFSFEGTDPSKFDYETIINHLVRQIQESILQEFRSLGSSSGSGSRAVGGIQQELFYQYEQKEANKTAEKITRDIITDLVVWNYGRQYKVPKLKAGDVKRVDVNNYADAVKKLTDSGLLSYDFETENILRKMLKLNELNKDDFDKKVRQEDKEEKKIIDDIKEEAPEEEEEKMSKEKLLDRDKKKTLNKDFLNKNFNRPLTLAEEKVDWGKWKKFFDKQSIEFQNKFNTIGEKQIKLISENISKGNQKNNKEISENEKKLADELKREMEKAIDFGKTEAMKELNLDMTKRPATTQEIKDLQNIQAMAIARQQKNDLENLIVFSFAEGLRNGLNNTQAIRQAISKAREKMSSQSVVMSDTNTGIAVNGGVSIVHDINEKDIALYQYSAVLDGRTSNICLSLDGRVVENKKDLPQPPLHFNCLVAGTKIITDKGEKNIEDIKIGDMVLTHRESYKKVIELMENEENKEIYIIECGKNNKLRITGNHPVLVKSDIFGAEWVLAKNIKKNDILFIKGFKDYPPYYSQIKSIIKKPFKGIVYNFSVKDDESYFASNICVHNCRSRIVAIDKKQTIKPELNQPPKSIIKNLTGDFTQNKQPKSAIVDKNSDTADQIKNEIKERQDKIKKYEEQGKYPNRIKEHEKAIKDLEAGLK